ncbi:RNA polymerase sigma factor [Bacillus sp. KH172YL63]|uniref:RNA polymerase sigma factor n=1 Tax=Bacillus sp. KH172YL63 TaxID=2709784 RepID=UPI0013E4FADE|nr:sigma-70 family RNA polymerase sigma factor [Bacillus sp. KH172YL63]BCB03958.1 RNA polymerase sigma factor [Bacillus sp. KH172YL63]
MFINETKAAAIFNEYRDYVYRTALLLTRSRSLADDITQETFIKILSNYDTYDPARPIKPWIYTITMNVAKTVMKKQKILKCLSFFSDDLSPNHIDSVEEVFQKETEVHELWEVVNSLSWKSKEIIILHFYSELTLKECAHVLGIPVGTAKSRLHTALKQLRKLELKKKIDFSEAGLYEKG